MNQFWYRTRAGVFRILQTRDGWHPVFEDRRLGRYDTPQQALDDLAGGHTWSIPGGVDTSRLGLPDELADWHTGAPDD